MTAPQIIIDLVESFKRNEDFFKDGKKFNEENTKTNFITPFFEALGWDVTNKRHLSPQFQDVVFEKPVKIGGKTKLLDYSFRIGESEIFALEAKKPSVNIKEDSDPALQLRRYGWNSKLKLGILTNFEELAVYDTTFQTKKNERPHVGRIKYYHYSEYIEKWDEIAGIFSKDAVLKGDFYNFTSSNSNKKKRGTGEVDDEFLKEIEHWRDLLARNIALRNKDLNEDALNYAVQITIDRIIFCRMAEDRGIEKYGTLLELTEKKDIYQHLMEVFKIADLKYNSGLFCLSADPARHINRNMVTEHLIIDDGVFKEIFTGLYYPKTPYEFSIISPEILGQVYEQLLGSVIRLTPSHMAKVEEKPEVKKAGGVFYTPQHIVKYIVKNTLGELLKGKKPNQVSKIRILDPACGSGSFLLVAYQYLLDWHLNYYLEYGNQKHKKEVIYQGKDGKWRLTIREKKRILKNNIYGVDIDFLAVEVTKLSLLLKVLEDQNKDVVEQQQTLFHERVLPDLSDNIKNGNSLIKHDILENEDLSMEDVSKINPFDWEDDFRTIFEDGGFDIVIGNPPYVSIELIDEISKKYYQENYDTFVQRADLFNNFLEQSIRRLSKNYISFIVPSIIFSNISYKKIRNLILDNKYLSEACYTGNKVFSGANIDTTILTMNKNGNKEIVLKNALNFNNKKSYVVKNDYFKTFNNVLSVDTEDTTRILEKIFIKNYDNVKDNFTIFQGIVTGNNPAFIFENEKKALKEGIEPELLKPVVFGRDINQWEIENKTNVIIYINGDYKINKYPKTKEWLSNFRADLRKRRECKKGTIPWYSLQWPRKQEELDIKEKILIQRTRNERLKRRIVATIDNSGVYATEGIFFIIQKTDKYSLYFLLALLNSDLINYVFGTKFLNLGMKKDYLNKVKFPKLTLEEQQPFIDLSKKLLDAHERLLTNKSPKERKIYQKQSEIAIVELNQLVYELYDLTDEEIKIIEDHHKE